jgi:hypothetical protein
MEKKKNSSPKTKWEIAALAIVRTRRFKSSLGGCKRHLMQWKASLAIAVLACKEA